MIADCVTKELVLYRTQSKQEQQEIIRWHHTRMEEDIGTFPYSPLSLGVAQVRCTLGVLQLGGQEPYKKTTVMLSNRPGKKFFVSHKDHYMQLPVRVMWGSGISWALMLMILSNPQ